MKALRSIRVGKLQPEVQKFELISTTDIQDVVKFAKSSRRHWRHHIDRMGNNRWAKWTKDQTFTSRSI